MDDLHRGLRRREMTITGVFGILLLCAAAIEGEGDGMLACNLDAMGRVRRPRYNELRKRLQGAMRGRKELTNGYEWALDAAGITDSEIAEWVEMERLCCPFLDITVRTLPEGKVDEEPGWSVTLTGPAGVKGLLQAEFAGGSASPQGGE